MGLVDVGRAHIDGGIDAFAAPGVTADIAGHCMEAAVLGALIATAWELLRNQESWMQARPVERKGRLMYALKALAWPRSVGLTINCCQHGISSRRANLVLPGPFAVRQMLLAWR